MRHFENSDGSTTIVGTFICYLPSQAKYCYLCVCCFENSAIVTVLLYLNNLAWRLDQLDPNPFCMCSSSDAEGAEI